MLNKRTKATKRETALSRDNLTRKKAQTHYFSFLFNAAISDVSVLRKKA
jgi:hypothetical protein